MGKKARDAELILRIGNDDHIHTHLLGLNVKDGVFVLPFRTADTAENCLKIVLGQVRRYINGDVQITEDADE